jgi:iron(III) transport system permease protein
MDDRIAASQLASMLLAGVALLIWLERRAAAAACASPPAVSAPHTAAEARPIALRVQRCGAGRSPIGLCCCRCCSASCVPVAVLLRLVVLEAHDAAAHSTAPAVARFVQWGWTSLRLRIERRRRSRSPLSLARPRLRGPPCSRGGAAASWATRRGLARLRGAGRGDRGRHPAAGGLAAAALAPGSSARRRSSPAPCFGLMVAYLVRFSAVALQSVEAGYARVPASVDETARMLGASRRRLIRRAARAAAAPLGDGCGAARLRRRDEGAAGDAAAAPLRQRHARGRRLPTSRATNASARRRCRRSQSSPSG